VVRAEAGPLVETGELAIGAQETLPHHILGILLVPGHKKSQSEESTAVALDDLAERVGIARARPADDGCIGQVHPAAL